MRRGFESSFFLFLFLAFSAVKAFPADRDELTVLQDADASERTFPSSSLNGVPKYRVAAGVSYTGIQARYQFSNRWATEARFQFGTADSNYGDVNANVYGLRGYRFIPYRKHVFWYLGGEAAYAQAKADRTDYETHGFALGAFGGLEYRPLPRLSFSADIGPYLISLKEKQTHQSQSSLDFVINTAINVYLF